MKALAALFLLLCILISGCTKEYVEMDVISSRNSTSSNWYELEINVIADENIASDKDACSQKIIQHILDNDFRNTRFSFDVNGYPNEVAVDVYTSERNFEKGKKSYSFRYVTKFNTENVDIQNNIKDNPDAFKIQYE